MKGEIHASPFDHWGCVIFKGAFFWYIFSFQHMTSLKMRIVPSILIHSIIHDKTSSSMCRKETT